MTCRRHLQTFNARNGIAQLLGYAVTEVLLRGVAAQIDEGQHSDRLHCRLGVADTFEHVLIDNDEAECHSE